VLWVSAALAAIAFSVAATVRGETERTSTLADGVRTYYLASGAIDRWVLYTGWQDYRNADGTPQFYETGMARVYMQFPTGVATVEVIPETAKLHLNESRPEELFHLLVALGADPDRAREIANAIIDWRSPAPGGMSIFDQHYLSLSPSFRGRHASFEEIEELLLVKGMTPDLYYGTFVRDAQGNLSPRGGLKDCVSVYGSSTTVDANYAHPAVLASIGIPPAAVTAIVQRRRAQPFRNPADLNPFAQMAGPAGNRLSLGQSNVYTIRATGQLRYPDGRLNDLTRSVSAVFKFNQPTKKRPNLPRRELLRWYDN
jgi:general secretion pathway protein K